MGMPFCLRSALFQIERCVSYLVSIMFWLELKSLKISCPLAYCYGQMLS